MAKSGAKPGKQRLGTHRPGKQLGQGQTRPNIKKHRADRPGAVTVQHHLPNLDPNQTVFSFLVDEKGALALLGGTVPLYVCDQIVEALRWMRETYKTEWYPELVPAVEEFTRVHGKAGGAPGEVPPAAGEAEAGSSDSAGVEGNSPSSAFK